jgi:hypothetical protein
MATLLRRGSRRPTVSRDASMTWLASSPACVTRIGPKRAPRAANKASNGKPFVYEELVARMRAVLRRSNGPRHPRLSVCELEIDLASSVVTVGGDPVQLSAKEYELLVALAEDPERVFKKEELLRKRTGASGHSVGRIVVTPLDALHTVPPRPSRQPRV